MKSYKIFNSENDKLLAHLAFEPETETDEVYILAALDKHGYYTLASASKCKPVVKEK